MKQIKQSINKIPTEQELKAFCSSIGGLISAAREYKFSGVESNINLICNLISSPGWGEKTDLLRWNEIVDIVGKIAVKTTDGFFSCKKDALLSQFCEHINNCNIKGLEFLTEKLKEEIKFDNVKVWQDPDLFPENQKQKVEPINPIVGAFNWLKL